MESTSPKKSENDYETLLASARQSQAAVDRAIEELRQIQRYLSEGPALIASRRKAVELAQDALEGAELKVANARTTMTAKQVEVAKLMESAAACQQALARCLSPGQDFPELNPPARPVNLDVPAGDQNRGTNQQAPKGSASAANPSNTSHSGKARGNSPVADAMSQGKSTTPDLPTTGWDTTYAFPTTNTRQRQDEDDHGGDEVVKFLSDRDVLCPSCGTPLRGVRTPRCTNCRMRLSLAVLKTTGPRGSTKLMWSIRLVAGIAFLMSLYLAFVGLTNGSLVGCGGGSRCELVYTSGYAKIMRIPIAAFGAVLYAMLGIASFFAGVGRRDRTRWRAWSAMSLLAAIAGGGALWFLFIQIVMIKGICPHCMVVDVCGLIVAFLVLKNAPFMRPEKLPDDAIGPITFSKRNSLIHAAIAVTSLGLFIGVHAAFKGHAQQLQGNRSVSTKEKKTGLMMGGLNLDSTKPKDQPAKDAGTPATNGDTKSGGTPPPKDQPTGLMFKPLDLTSDPSKDNTKAPEAKDTKKPDDKEPDKSESSGLLFKIPKSDPPESTDNATDKDAAK